MKSLSQQKRATKERLAKAARKLSAFHQSVKDNNRKWPRYKPQTH